MTIAALRHLLDAELPDVRRHPAPLIPHHAHKRSDPVPSPIPAPRPPGPNPAASPVPVGVLLAWATRHTTRSLAQKGERAHQLIVELRALHTAEQRLAAVDAEEQQLLQQLEAVRARKEELRPRRASAPADYDPATVRAWAAEHGRPVAPRGVIPAVVVRAWREATQGGTR